MVVGWSSIPWWSLGHTGGGVGLLLCAYPQQRHMEMIWLDRVFVAEGGRCKVSGVSKHNGDVQLSTCTPTIEL